MLRVPRSAPAIPVWVNGGVKAILRDIPGAVVVVEEQGMAPMGPAQVSVDFLQGRLRVFASGAFVPGSATPGVPLWMDPTVTLAGGNVVNRLYALGGSRF